MEFRPGTKNRAANYLSRVVHEGLRGALNVSEGDFVGPVVSVSSTETPAMEPHSADVARYVEWKNIQEQDMPERRSIKRAENTSWYRN